MTFLDNDPPVAGSSTITAQMSIVRSGSALAFNGVSTTGGGTGFTNVPGSFALPLVRSTPFAMALELDKNLDKYSVYYKDGAASYALLGSGELGLSTLNSGDRDGNSIRFASTGQFNDTGEFVDISRIYLTDTSPVGPVTPVALTLEAKSNGILSIKNTTSNPITFNSYRTTSAMNSLNFASWNSLSDQNISAVDGPDPGLTPGDGIGETWDEAGGSGDGVLAESFLLGCSTLAPNDFLDLGSAFDASGTHDLTFQYYDSVSNAIVTGEFTYPIVAAGVQGDYNNNGLVDAADYVLWRKGGPLQNDPSPGVSASDYTFWRSRFGSNTGSGAGDGLPSPTTIPEPNAWLLLGLATTGLCIGRRKLFRCSHLIS